MNPFTWNRREFFGLSLAAGSSLVWAGWASVAPPPRVQAMRATRPDQRITIDAEPGVYMHSAGVVCVGEELVCVYRRSNLHCASESQIACVRSSDGGKTWSKPEIISRSSFDEDGACWVCPQLASLPDGRLVVISDRGNKKHAEDWPMLSHWQLPDRGMSNHLFVSADGGRSWERPRKIDDVGGEPSYLRQLSDGSWMFTRTESQTTQAKKNPALPWGDSYYRSVAVFSDDAGQTFDRTVTLSDDPLIGDCEVGFAETASGRLLAISRVGDGGGQFGQPSRMFRSDDLGKTWGAASLTPFYAQRPCVGRLQSGKILVTYRNRWGTPGSYAVAFGPEEPLPYEPSLFAPDESRCVLRGDMLEIHSARGARHAVEYRLYPLEDDDSACALEAELLVKSAEREGCVISAGVAVRIEPQRVSLADRPEMGFALDAAHWRRYRLVHRDQQLQIFVDDELRWQGPTVCLTRREVGFGNRAPYQENAAHTFWRSVHAVVQNRRDHSIDWRWNAADGYPDPFRRNRVLCLERCGNLNPGDCGYSGWTQLPDGRIVVVDYTVGEQPVAKPLLRAYCLEASDLPGVG